MVKIEMWMLAPISHSLIHDRCVMLHRKLRSAREVALPHFALQCAHENEHARSRLCYVNLRGMSFTRQEWSA
jgi:hypothetical protein